MDYEWDAKKNAANILKHGTAFDLIAFFDWTTALIAPDETHSEKERRFTAAGFIGDRLYVCVYTWRKSVRRIISLRKANARERKFYAQKQKA